MFDSLRSNSMALPTREQALPDRPDPISAPERHYVLGSPMKAPFGDGLEQAVFALGCFWGAERVFWQLDGVVSTAVGYAGGQTVNPTYQDVCTGQTGHTEVVLVVFDPQKIAYEELLRVFYEAHDPTQGMRQGNDRGTQYRSAVYTTSDAQREAARQAQAAYGDALRSAGHQDAITTELAPLTAFYYAEEYHQQYLAKNPNGYCGIGGTGVSCPIGLSTAK